MLKKDIKQEWKRVLKIVCFFTVILLLVSLGIILLKEKVIVLGQSIQKLPKEVKAFLGCSNPLEKDMALLIFELFLVLFDMIVLCVIALNAAGILKREESRRTISFYLNQMMGKNDYFLVKLAEILLFSVFLWGIYKSECMLCIRLLSHVYDDILTGETRLLFNMSIRGLALLLFTLGCVVFYTSGKKKSNGTGMMLFWLYAISFIMGNLYKVFELLAFYQESVKKDPQVFEKAGRILKRLEVLFPFHYIDATAYSLDMAAWRLLSVYLILGILMFVCGWLLFRFKDFSK